MASGQRGLSESHGHPRYLAIFWHLLFFDAYLLLLRYGGLAMVDLLIHAVLLLAATACLALYRAPYRIPGPVVVIFAVVLATVLVQMIPLPEPLFSFLAPVKSRLVQEATSIFPEIAATAEITLLPDLHRVRFFSMLLDFALIALLFAAPPCRFRVFRIWLFVLSLTVGVLANLAVQNMLGSDSPLRMYRDTYGGLVNRNHFAFFSVVLMVFLWVQTVISAREIWLGYNHGGQTDARLVLRHGIYLAFSLCCLLLLINGFRISLSRAGVIAFLLAHGLFFALIGGRSLWHFARKRPLLLSGALVVLLALVALMPFGRVLDRIVKVGLGSETRIEVFRVGLDYLKEWPVLGTGIASSEAIIEPLEQKPPSHTGNIRRFHNEYLQTAVELGWPGFLCLVWFLVLVMNALVRARNPERFADKLLVSGAMTLLVLLILYAFFSFPLRITSIRVFALCAIALAIKRAWDVHAPRTGRRSLIPISLATLLCGGFFAWAASYTPPVGEGNPKVERAVHYGYHYRIPFFVANQSMNEVLTSPMPEAEIRERLSRARSLVLDHLARQPYSLKGMNLLFMVQVLEHKLENDGYDTHAYRDFKRKAKAIQAMGQDANISAKGSLLFLYAAYEAYLTGEEISEYEELQAYAAWSIERARDRMKQEESPVP